MHKNSPWVVRIALSALLVWLWNVGPTAQSRAALLEGRWELDEARSELLLMRSQVPLPTEREALLRSSDPRLPVGTTPVVTTHHDPVSIELSVSAEQITLTGAADAPFKSRSFAPVAGLRRVDGPVQTRVTWTINGAVFEVWEQVDISGVSATLYEKHAWSVEGGELTVVTETHTGGGRRTQRSVYRREAK